MKPSELQEKTCHQFDCAIKTVIRHRAITGDWGNKRPGTTLVGELGREMCVNPHTGKWYTVGDNGAEFVNIPQGAIVFNHVQTEELLSNGFTASRAVALASGTSPDISGKAFVSGNAMVTGGISVKQAQKSVISGGNTAKASHIFLQIVYKLRFAGSG